MTGASRPLGWLPALLVMLVLPLAVAYVVFVVALRAGGTGGHARAHGVAEVSDCHRTARTLGLLQDCTARSVRLDGAPPSADRRLVSASARHGRIRVVEQCVASRAFLVTSERCTLYPTGFPRSLWWWWTGLLAFPVAIFGFFTFRARSDLRRSRAPMTTPPDMPTEGEAR
jgi:hypothetical protein